VATQKRPNGRYSAKVSLGRGEYLLIPGTFATKGEAEHAVELEEARRLLGQGTERGRGGILCRAFAKAWTDPDGIYAISKKGPTRGATKNKTTLYRYGLELKPFLARHGDKPLRAITRTQAMQFGKDYPRHAIVVRNMFADAFDSELVEANPFTNLNLQEKPGRKHYWTLHEPELRELADYAIELYPKDSYGAMCWAYILFTGYVGSRLAGGMKLRWEDVDFDKGLVTLHEKFSKTRTVGLHPEAAKALRTIPRKPHGYVFYGRRGQPLCKGTHTSIWDPIRTGFWATLPQERKDRIVDLDWHSLRHFCAHYTAYEMPGGSERLAAWQLGHTDEKLIRELYGHSDQGAAEEMQAAYARLSA
jgi:integrase